MFVKAAILLLVLGHVELVVVHTGAGSVRGVPADDGDYTMFLGVPYARVNVSNPFGASIPHPRFKKVFEANDDSTICVQFVQKDVYEGAIDCLRLNIYVPNTKNDNKAVFIYIHGGNNKFGHYKKYLYGPKYLVQHDIILITINYRLGPYGFLCTDHPEISGNQGLKDQYTAIKWVKDHVKAFKGDPQKITIGGHSSGSMCADAHLRTKHPRMFQQAILQSGTVTYPRYIVPRNNNKLLVISDKLGFKTKDVTKAMTFLAKVNPQFIKDVAKSMEWYVCVEKEFQGVFRYIDEHPEASEAPIVDGMNILGGYTNREGVFKTYGDSYQILKHIPDILHYDLSLKFDFETDKAYEIIRRYYNEESKANATIAFLTDFEFIHPMQRALKKYSKHRNTTVFQYMFTYEREKSLEMRRRLYNVTERGATHADELGLIFDGEDETYQPTEAEMETVSKAITKLWTNFIKYGNPTPATSGLVTWPPLTADAMPCLQIDANLTVISRPFPRNMAFWDLVFYVYENKLRKDSLSLASTISRNFSVFLICSVIYFYV